MDDPETAPLSASERALLVFVRSVVGRCVTDTDLAAVRGAGWSDDALYDAITVVSLFQFYNTWIDGTGVKDMSPQSYAASGVRLATDGYAPEHR